MSNGEFGDRLIGHAAAQNLDFERLQTNWGEPLCYAGVRRRLEQRPDIGWLWAVHCETSTGVLNDLCELKQITAERSVRLCLDAVSSVGAVPVDLQGVYLASCVSGKGLASYSGLSMVFYNHTLSQTASRIPRYLDLRCYSARAGVPFTQSSNLVCALHAALSRTCWEEKYQRVAADSAWLRARLREAGLPPVAPNAHAAPAVITIALPRHISSRSVGWRLWKNGYLLSYNSEYLLERNWIQICLMGDWKRSNLVQLPEAIAELCDNAASTGHHIEALLTLV